MSKTVTIGIEMDSHFVSLLNASVGLGNLRDKDRLTAIEQLALTALAEARGGLEAEVWATILPEWRPYLDTVPNLRTVRVLEDAKT